MIYKKEFWVGQVWRSKAYPHEDFLINYVDWLQFKNVIKTPEKLIDWIRWNKEAFNKFVCEKKGFNSIDELFKTRKNTFPYSYGDCSQVNTIRRKIKQYNMYLDETISTYTGDKLNVRWFEECYKLNQEQLK